MWLQLQILALWNEFAVVKTDVGDVLIANAWNVDAANGSVKRIALQPARLIDRRGTLESGISVMAGIDAGDGSTDNRTHAVMISAASLMPTPQQLFDLWLEYQYGIVGRKPARLF